MSHNICLFVSRTDFFCLLLDAGSKINMYTHTCVYCKRNICLQHGASNKINTHTLEGCMIHFGIIGIYSIWLILRMETYSLLQYGVVKVQLTKLFETVQYLRTCRLCCSSVCQETCPFSWAIWSQIASDSTRKTTSLWGCVQTRNGTLSTPWSHPMYVALHAGAYYKELIHFHCSINLQCV